MHLFHGPSIFAQLELDQYFEHAGSLHLHVAMLSTSSNDIWLLCGSKVSLMSFGSHKGWKHWFPRLSWCGLLAIVNTYTAARQKLLPGDVFVFENPEDFYWMRNSYFKSWIAEDMGKGDYWTKYRALILQIAKLCLCRGKILHFIYSFLYTPSKI